MAELLQKGLGVPARLQQGWRRFSGRTPLQVKLVVLLLTLVTLALVAAGAAATAALRGYLVNRVDEQLLDARPSVAAWYQDLALDLRRGGRAQLPPSNYPVQLMDAEGNSVLRLTYPGAVQPQLGKITIEQAMKLRDRAFTRHSVGGGPDWRVAVIPFSDRSGTLVLATSLGEVQKTLHRLVVLEVMIGVVVLLLLGVIGLVVVRRSLAPLVAVETTAEAIAGGDLSRRVPESDPRTEVGRLSRALNSMLTQIEQAFRVRAASEASARASEERMRRFVADASHELRTPLTSIRGFAELYRQGAVATQEDTGRLMRRIEDEAVRMGVLVEDLLLLARLDQQRPLRADPVDLLTLVRDAVHDARAVEPDRPIELDVRPGPLPPVVTGDEMRLRQVLGNLVTNALVHTPPGTPVQVRLRTEDGGQHGWASGPVAVLEVRDQGPGLTPAEAERVFERFYRGDPSRTRGAQGGATRQGGTGLGLSIVAALTAAHQGKVEVDSEPGRGAAFRVLLPLRATTG